MLRKVNNKNTRKLAEILERELFIGTSLNCRWQCSACWFFLFLQIDKNGTNENKVLMKSVPGRNSLVERQKKKIQNKQQITKELLDACI